MQHSYAVPTQNEQDTFVYRLYFGADGDAVDQAVRRAYKNLSRTAHGIGTYPTAYEQASKLLRQELTSLPSNTGVYTQAGFDLWHKATCDSLCNVYSSAGYMRFFTGQAQKWVNMTLKYVYVFGEARLPGYMRFYPLCHVPIDNILLGKSEFKGLGNFKVPWSRIQDYSEYLAFQVAVRERFSGAAPLSVEFHVWQRPNAA